MATSRYATGAGGIGSVQQPIVTGTNTSTSGNTSQSGSSTSTTVTDQTRNTQSQNMSDESLAALELLIQQLLGGGTQNQAREMAQRQEEINRTRQQQAAYSKEAAFADSQGAMSKFLADAIRQNMPTITRSAEGAGTSQNSMRALLAQDVANKAAEGAAALGLQSSVNYGQISQGLSSVLEALTRPNDTVTQALINALNVAKGAVTNSQEQTSGTSTTTGSSTNNTSTNQNVSQSNQFAPGSVNAMGTSGFNMAGVPSGGANLYFGPTISDADLVSMISRGTTSANSGAISSLLSNNAWQGYTF